MNLLGACFILHQHEQGKMKFDNKTLVIARKLAELKRKEYNTQDKSV